jgi:hypothetical protein
MKAATRPRKASPERIVQDINSFVSLAMKDTYKLSGAMFSAGQTAPNQGRYLELIRGIAETDFPHWRERLNYYFRAIRGLSADATRRRRPSAKRGRRAAGRRTRKVSS